MLEKLELLLNIPIKYDINYLSTQISHNKEAVLYVKILDIKYKQKTVNIKFEVLNLNLFIEGIFFHFKSFMKKNYFINNLLYIKGLIDIQNGYIKIIQPKIVTQINTIIPVYKGIKTVTKHKILALKKDDFDNNISNIVDSILKLHKPTLEFAIKFNQTKQFSQAQIYALKYIEYYIYYSKLIKKRKTFKALKSFNITQKDLFNFIQRLPFELTDDQKNALNDIISDLTSSNSAKRVIVGDVGSGKTVLILACAFIAKLNKSRTILMTPTSVLANQIYLEAKKYLNDLKITLFTNKFQPKNDLEEFDFIIGTHALLYTKLPKYELILVDEQHKFGTNQRALLDKFSKADKKKAHYLQFSATPIPRTLALIESNLVDFSFLRQTPFKKDIKTIIIGKKDFKALLNHIHHEIKHNRQVIIVYPLVQESQVVSYQSIDEAKEYWYKNFKNVFITYGKDKDKENILKEFQQTGDILISTTVIEVGISLPRLSTIVIVGAERLGFASLHQLRGRVSRNGLKGYCYLYTNDINNTRLKEFAKTTNGFEIAELDLRFRQSGDILYGKEQSGLQFKWLDLSEDFDIIKKVQVDYKKDKNEICK